MKSIEELLAIKEKAQAQIAARDAEGNDGLRVVVGMATCGIAAGARPVLYYQSSAFRIFANYPRNKLLL